MIVLPDQALSLQTDETLKIVHSFTRKYLCLVLAQQRRADSNSGRTDAVKQLVNVYGGAMCDDDGPGARRKMHW